MTVSVPESVAKKALEMGVLVRLEDGRIWFPKGGVEIVEAKFMPIKKKEEKN